MTTYSKKWHYENCMGLDECEHGDPECPHNHFLRNEKCNCGGLTMNEEELQKILIDHKTREINLVEATTKLQSLILKARLSEAELLYDKKWDGEIGQRIAQLKAEIKALNTKIGGSDEL